MQDITIKKTHELTPNEKKQFLEGFNECFPKHVMTEDQLFSKYVANHFVFSYHALCFENDRIIGSLSASPFWYDYNGERVKIALTCDIFIVKEFRSDIRLFANLNKALKDYCAKEGIICFLGVANDNAYTYTIRILRCKEVMTLPFWILPIRIGNVAKKKWLKPLNVLSLACAYLSLGVNSLISKVYNSRGKQFICKIRIDEDFLSKRLPDTRYSNYNKEGIYCSYIVTNDEDIRCAYIMMFSEEGLRSYKALCKCVRHILRKERVDLIMFNGTLNIKQALLIKTPQRMEPRRIHLTVNYLTKDYEKKYSDIMKPNGIDFTLLNLDVR